ncbi:hypothetical protein [Peribacillus butanolivorans]|uniref:hypothetical protein n=1 Tax=Peribacillus butanolivorans TaxID=421767 RepID=UPI00366E034D
MNKMLNVTYHKSFEREFWESIFEKSPFEKNDSLWNLSVKYVSNIQLLMKKKNLNLQDYKVSFIFNEDNQLDFINIQVFRREDDIEIKNIVINNDENLIKNAGIFLDSLMEFKNNTKQSCNRNDYFYLLIQHKELSVILNLIYQYIQDKKVNVDRNSFDTIEFIISDYISNKEKKVELFSDLLIEDNHFMKSISKIERVSTNRVLSAKDKDKVLILKEIINYSTILNFYNGHINIIGKAVPYNDNKSELKSLFSFQLEDVIKKYKILDCNQALVLEL